MVKLEHSVIINRPVEEVFSFVASPDKEHLWNQETRDSRQISDGPMGPGTTVGRTTHFLGRKIESVYEVTEYEVNSKRGERSISGPVPYELVQLFEAVDGGTRVTATGQVDAGGFFRVAEPLFRRMAARQQRANYANLKAVLESTGSGD